jgi:hypothetical protein
LLKVLYILDPAVGPDVPVEIRETAGQLMFHCSPARFTEDTCMALTMAHQAMLDGGHWFQLWDGAVVGINSTTANLL